MWERDEAMCGEGRSCGLRWMVRQSDVYLMTGVGHWRWSRLGAVVVRREFHRVWGGGEKVRSSCCGSSRLGASLRASGSTS